MFQMAYFCHLNRNIFVNCLEIFYRVFLSRKCGFLLGNVGFYYCRLKYINFASWKLFSLLVNRRTHILLANICSSLYHLYLDSVSPKVTRDPGKLQSPAVVLLCHKWLVREVAPVIFFLWFVWTNVGPVLTWIYPSFNYCFKNTELGYWL